MFIAAQAHYHDSGYDFSLGGSKADQIRTLALLAGTRARSWFHYSHFSVCEVDGEVVSCAAGFDKNVTDSQVGAALLEAGWTHAMLLSLDRRLQRIYECFPPDPEGSWTIEHVASLPQFRRRGLVRGVVASEIERGRKLGFTKAKLDVFAGNVAARSLYLALGFTVDCTFGEKEFREVLQRGALERMTLLLV